MAEAAPTTFKTWGCYYNIQLAWSRCYFEYNTHGARDTPKNMYEVVIIVRPKAREPEQIKQPLMTQTQAGLSPLIVSVT